MSLGARAGDRIFWAIAFAAFVVTGVGWTMAMPPLGQPDEPSHAQRAAAVARGQLTWKAREETVYEHFLRVRRTNTVVDIPAGYAELEPVPVCFAFVDDRDASCARPVSSSDEIVEGRPYTGTYPPLTAIIQSPGGRFDAPTGLVVMRLCTVVVTAGLLASALVAARRLGGGAVAAGAALSFTPVVVSLMAAINPSALEIAAAACLWLSLLDVLRPGPVDRRAVWRTVVAAVVLVLSRPLSPASTVAIVGVVLVAVPWRDRLRELRAVRSWWVWTATVAAAFITACTWIVLFEPHQAVVGAPEQRPFGGQLARSLGLVGRRTEQLVAPIGWLDVPLPTPVVWTWLGVTAALALLALVVGSWRQRAALVLLLAGILLGPTLAELPTAGRFGLIWQGRYTLPLALGLPLLAGWVVHVHRLDRRLPARLAALGVVLASAATNLLAVAVALTDRQTGRAWPLDVELGRQVWSADVRGGVVLAVTGAGLAVLAAVLGTLAVRPGGPAPARPAPAAAGPLAAAPTPAAAGPAVC